jgi:16S rRNA (guanine527-N7)-methyltransferase
VPRPPPPQPISAPDDLARDFGASPEALERLATYESLLRQWQKALNLVAPATLDKVWHRHFGDSAQLLPLIPEGRRHLVDIGSGAGFPGLVLAVLLAGRSEVRVSLVESDQRKAAFLREVARQVAIPVDILSTRIESPETQIRLGSVDVVTARALAPLDRLLDWSAPLFGLGTVGLFLKGRGLAREIAAAEARWRFDVEVVASRTEAESAIAMIRAPSLRAAEKKEKR